MRLLILIWLILASGASYANAVQLFDASLGNLPDMQSWLLNKEDEAVIVHNGSGVNLDGTGSFSLRPGIATEFTFGGFSQHPLMPVINRQEGFYLEFSLQIVAETHNPGKDDNNDGLVDRAGFSVIIISEDLYGVELSFFEDKIWASEDGKLNSIDKFTQAESVIFDTSQTINYTLAGSEEGYALFANGTKILSGVWRSYHPSGVEPLIDPYDNPSFIFLGDNTRSASSSVILGNISIATTVFTPPSTTSVLVPIPFPALVLFVCAIFVSAQRYILFRTRL